VAAAPIKLWGGWLKQTILLSIYHLSPRILITLLQGTVSLKCVLGRHKNTGKYVE
jgi:hypothetical protein